ncbi:MAG: aminotransferase class I and II [Conexibacteraceae bacterium]|nr:aminotransferase class I and II [Conexibacteraceae bacterium]
MLRTVAATRYVTALREGGSLPGLVEADDDGLYVVKFWAAGQGVKALVAEVIVGELARAAGLPVPEIVLVELSPELGRTEPDPEINELVTGSAGLNVGIDFLPGALDYNPAKPGDLDPLLASQIVWFDAFTTNVDRTPRNPNLLVWHRRTWMIDHGAALYLQHGERDLAPRAREPFLLIADHVLLPLASELREADARMSAALTPELIAGVVGLVPDAWLTETARASYRDYLAARVAPPRGFLTEAEAARGA